MADPISAGVMLAVTAFQTFGAVQTSQFNEDIAEQNRLIVGDQTQANYDQQRRENIRRLGAARAAAGASGRAADGSVLDIFEESVMNAELDLLNIKYSGALAERGFRNEELIENKEPQGAILKGVISGAYKAGNAAGGGGVI